MEIYLDNSATTRCLESVVQTVGYVMTEDYGNPSSMHRKGVSAEKYLRYTSDVLARNMKVSEKEIIYTSGGTESDNLAIIGAAYANARGGRHLITSTIEHPAVLKTMEYLESQGFEVTYLPVDCYGRVSPESVRAAIRTDTILVSVMFVNNEIGSVQPIAEIGAVIKKINPTILFHVDAVQAYGKYRICPKRLGIDMMSVSGHKIHGPKGSGFLYVGENVKIHPIMFGGGQQKGMRSGTQNVPGIAGLGKAVEEVYGGLESDVSKLYHLKETLVNGLLRIEGVTINGLTGYDSAPHIVSCSVSNVRAEVLLHALEEKGIYVSAGSACASNKPMVSKTLRAIGLKEELLESTIRMSLSIYTTMDEVEYTIRTMMELVPVLRRYVRRK